MPEPLPLITRRLRLEPIEHAHDEELQAATSASRAELEPWMPWAPGHTLETQHGFTERAQAAWVQGTEHHFAIVLEGQAVGVIGLRVPKPKEAEVGYWIATEAAGKGYVTEAAGALIEWGFTSLGLESVILEAGVDNLASRRVAEKLGFRRVGDVAGGMEGGNGIVFPAYVHLLTRPDWEASRQALKGQATKV